DVGTNVEKIIEHAGWLAYEELPFPSFLLPFGLGEDPEEAINFLMVANSIDFAFSDFSTGVKFETDYAGQRWSDSEALFACLKRALDDGVAILDGGYLSRVTKADLQRVFRGNIEMPMLDERVEILRAAGKILAENYDGRFSNFVESASPRLYDNGRGLIDKLVKEFPRFNDISDYDGHEVKIYKLAQLGFWMLYAALGRSGGFRLEDPGKLTAFADYIVPVALRVMEILRYSPALEEAIGKGRLIARDSPQEIEIRAHTIYATALLTEEVNKRRPADRKVIIPQIDARLWTHYHKTHWPHHLTRTIMY
ncbi:MAG: queuosine salvage family protein, partial [Terriglobales bacterium]